MDFEKVKKDIVNRALDVLERAGVLERSGDEEYRYTEKFAEEAASLYRRLASEDTITVAVFDIHRFLVPYIVLVGEKLKNENLDIIERYNVMSVAVAFWYKNFEDFLVGCGLVSPQDEEVSK